MPELDETTLRRVLVLDAQQRELEGAEQIYRCVAPLRDLLPADAQKCLAAIFEWAREGMNAQHQATPSAELEALQAAITYARDVLLDTARTSERNGIE